HGHRVPPLPAQRERGLGAEPDVRARRSRLISQSVRTYAEGPAPDERGPGLRGGRAGCEPQKPCFMAVRRSLLSWEITSSGIPLGQAAVHAPMLVQPPKPSWSCWPTMLTTRVSRSG